MQNLAGEGGFPSSHPSVTQHHSLGILLLSPGLLSFSPAEENGASQISPLWHALPPSGTITFISQISLVRRHLLMLINVPPWLPLPSHPPVGEIVTLGAWFESRNGLRIIFFQGLMLLKHGFYLQACSWLLSEIPIYSYRSGWTKTSSALKLQGGLQSIPEGFPVFSIWVGLA